METNHSVTLSQLSFAYSIIRNNNDCNIMYANSKFYKLLNLTQDEVEYKYGMRFSALIPVDDSIRIKNFMMADDQKEISFELPLKDRQNTLIWVHALFYKKDHEHSFIYALFIDVSRYKHAEMECDVLKAKLNDMISFSQHQILVYDTKSRQIQETYLKPDHMSAIPLQSLFPDVFLSLQFIHTDDISACLSICRDMEEKNRQISTVEIRLKNKHGQYNWMRMTLSEASWCDTSTLCILEDIHAYKQTLSAYIDQSLYYQAVLIAQDAYAHCDITDNKIIKAGGLWASYYEYKDELSYFDIYHQFIDKYVHKEDRAHYLEAIHQHNLIASYDNGLRLIHCNFRRMIDQNKMAWMSLTIHLFINPMNKHIMSLMYIKNKDEEKKQIHVQRVEKEYDSLTKLYTKNIVEYQISSYLTHMKEDEICAFIIMDINELRKINDTYGYIEGDKVLLRLTEMLLKTFRKCDIIGRFGGDEFIILLKNITKDKIETRIHRLFERIKKQKDPSFQVSAGVVYTAYNDSFANCFKQANLALYTAKQHCSGFYHVFQQHLDEQEKDQTFQTFLQQQHLSRTSMQNDDSFEHLLNDQGEIAYLVDPKTYELLIGNQALYNRIGMTQEECHGKHCYELLYKRSTPCPFCQKMNWTFEEFFMYRNYNEVLEQEFLIKNKLVTWKGDAVLLALAIDLSNDKSVVEYIKNETVENNYLLMGIQNMQKASTLQEVVYSALETILSFFRGEAVRFWKYDEQKKVFLCPWQQIKDKSTILSQSYDEHEIAMINEWFKAYKWNDYILIENQEAMMAISYEMYQIMQNHGIYNQRWCTICDDSGNVGMIEIDNLSTNYSNGYFMRSFKFYLINEWRRYLLMDNIIFTASHDPLTGLLNRSSYDEYSKHYDEDDVSSVTVIVIDIDGLSNINAMKGTKTGDYYLKQLAKYLKIIFQKDQIFRLSGDEFQVIMVNASCEEVERSINELQCLLDELDLFTISIGYDRESVEKKIKEMAQYATQAMLTDKRQHQNRSQDMHDRDYYKMQNQLLACFQRNEFMIYLQPKINTKTRYVIGAEALIRYHLKDGTIVPPSKYVPMLEKIGLIRYIDMFVFEEVCKILHKWRKSGVKCPVISLNFSRLTMMEYTLINGLETIISKYDVDKKNIEIEITESYADVGKALLYQGAKRIHNAGFSVSLDDFGTDYTNLSILSDIHVDVLKIDKSLIHSMAIQSKNQVILKNIIQMCHDLQVEVIAEGVEDLTQKDLLQEFGCYLIQGYYYSKPVPIEVFEQVFLDQYVDK